jgi:hypothetical protein
MSAETDKKISEMIEQAEPVADPLEDLVEQRKPIPARRLSPRY